MDVIDAASSLMLGCARFYNTLTCDYEQICAYRPKRYTFTDTNVTVSSRLVVALARRRARPPSLHWLQLLGAHVCVIATGQD